MATLEGGWSPKWYEYPYSIVYGRGPKLPIPPPPYVFSGAGDPPKSFIAEDGTVRHESRTRLSFGAGNRRWTYANCFMMAAPGASSSAASAAKSSVQCVLPNCGAASRLIALSGNDLSNAYDHIAKFHPTELAYDDVEAFTHVKAAAAAPTAARGGSGGATTQDAGQQSIVSALTMSQGQRAELIADVRGRLMTTFVEMIVNGNFPFNIVENDGVRGAFRLLLGSPFTQLKDGDIPTISRRNVTLFVDAALEKKEKDRHAVLQLLMADPMFFGSITADEWTPPGNTETIAGATLHWVHRSGQKGDRRWALKDKPLTLHAFPTVERS